jgi:hypothetical protein
MSDERVPVANVRGPDVRPYVLGAPPLEAYPVVSIAGNPRVGVVAFSSSGPATGHSPAPMHPTDLDVSRRRRPFVCWTAHLLGQRAHQSSETTVKGRLRVSGGSMS